MRRTILPEAAVALLAAAASSAAPLNDAAPSQGGGLVIIHAPAECMVSERYPTLRACFSQREELARAAVNFQAVGVDAWHSVEMKSDKACFEAVLPRPEPSITKIRYYIVIVDRASRIKRTPEYVADVMSDNNACQGAARKPSPYLMNASVVVGVASTNSDTPAFPSGFMSDEPRSSGASAAPEPANPEAAARGPKRVDARDAAVPSAQPADAARPSGKQSRPPTPRLSLRTLALVGGGIAATGIAVSLGTAGRSNGEESDGSQDDGFFIGQWSGTGSFHARSFSGSVVDCQGTARTVLTVTDQVSQYSWTPAQASLDLTFSQALSGDCGSIVGRSYHASRVSVTGADQTGAMINLAAGDGASWSWYGSGSFDEKSIAFPWILADFQDVPISVIMQNVVLSRAVSAH